MSLLDGLIGRIVPYNCLGCGAEGKLFCAACAAKLQAPVPCCYRCRAASTDSLTCQDCRVATSLRRVQAAALYDGLAKNLVWKLKFAHAQGAAREIAARMALLIDHEPWGSLLVVPIPTATTRVRQRGYDQARLLAREVAHAIGQPCADVLVRHSQAHQVGASRQQRQHQLADAFRVAKPKLIKNVHILLIDDVVTTGATLEAAAKLLKKSGAHQIDALVFAQPKFK